MIRLFASDVDGTLLNEKHKISDNVKEMVLNLHKNDVTFLFCSGRNFDGIKIIMDDLNVPAHYICSNGGVYYNENKELVFSQCLNEEDSLTIHEMAIKSDVTVQYYAKEKAYIQVPFDQYEKCNIKNFMAMMDVTQEEAKKFLETFNTRKLFIYEPDFNEILKKGIVKIEFHYRDKETKLIWEKQLKSMKNIHVTSSVDLNLEVSHKKATKGDMLLRVAKI